MRQPLIILVADNNMKRTLQGLLQRPQALGIHPVKADIFVHPGHDPGVFAGAHEFLRPFFRQCDHVLVLFDREGCGQEQKTAVQLQQEVQQRLDSAGWQGRSQVIVLDPELEMWVWSDSPHVARILGTTQDELRKMLEANPADPHGKPVHPKETMKEVLRRNGIPRSSALYEELAQHVSFRRCTDLAFRQMQTTLKRWFPG